MITDILFYVVGIVIIYFAYKVIKRHVTGSNKCAGCPASDSCKKKKE